MNAATRYTLAAMFVCSWSAGASAMGSADEIPQRSVHFADVDVSSGARAAILYSRIKIVAAQVCEQINARSLPAVAGPSLHGAGDQPRGRRCECTGPEPLSPGTNGTIDDRCPEMTVIREGTRAFVLPGSVLRNATY
jgi:UrcA family protein